MDCDAEGAAQENFEMLGCNPSNLRQIALKKFPVFLGGLFFIAEQALVPFLIM